MCFKFFFIMNRKEFKDRKSFIERLATNIKRESDLCGYEFIHFCINMNLDRALEIKSFFMNFLIKKLESKLFLSIFDEKKKKKKKRNKKKKFRKDKSDKGINFLILD